MSLVGQFGAAQDGLFVEKVQQAIINAAIAISSEATGTANHTNRVALAKAVLNNPASFAQVFAQGVANNVPVAQDGATTTANVTDAVIQTTVNGIWNGYAGVV